MPQQPGTAYVLEVNPRIPRRLARLEELANDLGYSWDRTTRELFARLHPQLWDAVGHSPKAMLKRIDERRLVDASDDPVFLNNFNRVLSAYDTYHNEPLRRDGSEWLRQTDLVAYFCAEFGFHESLPIYSGGLGILAGDHCKAASDSRLPFVGVGLLYRQGYFFQTIDPEGAQHAQYLDSDFDDLPVAPVEGEDGKQLRVDVELPGRRVIVKVWQARAGHVTLYLLDTALPENAEHDRDITHRLYGGDRTTRVEQEIVLGMGGVRALAALGIKPTVWHINEGHAAFLVLERIRGVMKQGLDFRAALEACAVSTVFTTHTAVAAGHDQFSEDTIRAYFEGFCKEAGIDVAELAALGRNPNNTEFNMTALAVRGSRFHNGVSRIHGTVSSRMLAGLWPQVPAEENPVAYVTNGVHLPTFLATEWMDIFDRFLGYGWSQRIADREFWGRLAEMPEHIFWSVRQHLKARMLHLVGYRMRQAHFRNQGSESHLDRILRLANPDDPNVLTIGFGRRFATYKRATLLLENLDELRQTVGDPQRPVLFIFAGKAHPADGPGQDVIRHLTHIARMPEFEGKLLLVEGYDLRLARRLVAGVDVWLNNPIYPLEASGTSGMKAGMNGVLNLSVLDGWWGEGYEGDNGWAIKPASSAMDQSRRAREEAQTLYELLQDQVIPMYYRRGPQGYSPEWIRMAKRAIATILPRFNSARMLQEYVAKFYLPASQQWRRYSENRFARAREVAQWKARVRAAWDGVTLRRLDAPTKRIQFGDSVRVEVAVRLNGLSPSDVVVELLIARGTDEPTDKRVRNELLFDGTMADAGEHRFSLDLQPELCGRLDYRIRAYPCHEALTHPFELGLMVWV
jgi:starch phosphorylase